MTKRPRNIAFGKANVVRRSAPKTIPVLAIDPLSLNSPALRKNVRTTLLLGTALGASLLTAMIVDSQPAMAVAVCQPSATVTTANANGIYCTTNVDLTVVTSGATTVLGGNSFYGGNDSGIEILTQAASPTPFGIIITAGGAGIGTGSYAGQVGGDGIYAKIRDYSSLTGHVTINISNAASDQIGEVGIACRA